MIEKKVIDKALDFYNIDLKYKKSCYECIENICNNDDLKSSFEKIYTKLYKLDFIEIKELWKLKNANELFKIDIDPFVTNLMILLGYKIHKENMNKLGFDEKQIKIHKKRIKECFENDLKNRGYNAIRLSQMLWAVYFIRGRIIEIGSLQFEYESDDKVKIHIPKNTDFNILKIKNSIEKSKFEIKKIFGINNYMYICNSWLLSNQIFEIIDKNTNIAKFHKLFIVNDGENCEKDILNFVYGLDKCENYLQLKTDTTLQIKIKECLQKGDKFYLGLGILK